MAQDLVVAFGSHETADFICDGVEDDVEIEAAIAEAKRRGVDVRLLPGNYSVRHFRTDPAVTVYGPAD